MMDAEAKLEIEYENAPCPGCGASGAHPVRTGVRDWRDPKPQEFDLIECDSCSLVRTDPRPTLESIPLTYPESYYSPAKLSALGPPAAPRQSRAGRARDLLAKPRSLRWGGFPPSDLEPGQALDIGAGLGKDLFRLQELGWSVTGVEPHPGAARAARRNLGLSENDLLVCSAEELELPTESLDLIVMTHVIEHLADPKSVLEKCGRWLRPGGTLIVSCPNFGSVESRVFGRYWVPTDLPRHLVHFTGPTLRALLEKTGFTVEVQIPQAHGPWSSVKNALRRGRPPGRRSDRRKRQLPTRAVTRLRDRTLEHLGYSPNIEVVAKTPVEPST